MIGPAAIRLEQARNLKEDAKRSAMSVSGIVLYVSILLLAARRYEIAGIWIIATLSMIVVTLLYARMVAASGITLENYRSYLRGHTAVTFLQD